MKKRFLVLTAFAMIANSQAAWAAFSIEQVLTATQTAVEKFIKENPTHKVGFTSYKAWKSGEEAKVKIFVTHEGMEMNFSYLCEFHDTLLECHAQ